MTLTKRQLQILVLIARGQRDKEIAASLKISARVVRFHFAAACKKLGATNRPHAVSIWLNNT